MGELTGRKVFAITAAFFGVIIAVNLFMARAAITTFPGIEVKNSYVASQTFDTERIAQEALGWTLRHEYDPAERVLRLQFTDIGTGYPSAVSSLSVLVGRATEARADTTPVFTRVGGVFVAPVALAPGKWLLRVEARAPDGTLFRQRLDLNVPG